MRRRDDRPDVSPDGLAAAEDGERAHRHAREAALLARMGELALQQALDAAPEERRARDAPRVRGHRSRARFSFHEARCSGESAASTAASYGRSVFVRPASRSVIAAVARRAE